MRYALIIAGGSGTRLWPMSRARQPKQLIPFINGKSLLQLAVESLEGLVPPDNLFICASQAHKQQILDALPTMDERRYLAEPTGRDTLNAVGLGAAVIGAQDPDATIGVFTADHIIKPPETYRRTVTRGFDLADDQTNTLVTFGITPTHAATGYGYLELGAAIPGHPARRVDRFKEKPDAETAQKYFDATADRYLWNSGMFVWRAATVMDCIKRYQPDNHAGLARIADAWQTDRRDATLQEVYPTLKKISIDFAVMEPASRDDKVTVAAVPMDLEWLDVGSWPAFAKTCDETPEGNATGSGNHVNLDSTGCLTASSDPEHLITTIGCKDLIVIHTPDATLVCPADQAERIKALHGIVGERWGDRYLD